MVTDTVDQTGENQEALEKAKLIRERSKAEYPFLIPDKSNFNGRLSGIQAFPETFFVDKKGQIVGETYSVPIIKRLGWKSLKRNWRK